MEIIKILSFPSKLKTESIELKFSLILPIFLKSKNLVENKSTMLVSVLIKWRYFLLKIER